MGSKNKKKGKKNAEKVEELNTDDFSSDGSDIEIESLEEDQPSDDNVTPISAANGADGAVVDQLKQEILYLKAEFDNYKKHAIKERSDLIKYGPERLAIEVVNVLDIFEMALSAEVTAENLDSFTEGMTMTHTQLAAALKKFGIEELSPLGEVFDPNMHEAMTNQPTDEFDEGTVCQVFKKGYKFHEKLIRPAQVVVASALEAPAPKE